MGGPGSRSSAVSRELPPRALVSRRVRPRLWKRTRFDGLLLRRRFCVVALGPLGEDLVAVLRFPREVALDQAFLKIGRNEIQRLGDAGNRDDRKVLGEK